MSIHRIARTRESAATLLCSCVLAAAAGAGEPSDAAKGAACDVSVAERAYRRIESRANVFTSSSQERSALALSARGGGVVAWQSRRQEEGTYGVYARRFAPDGAALGAEVRVNETTRGMQMLPAVALDGAGAAWFAWGSHAQDGDGGTVVARRFDPALADATPEIVVNEHVRGDQRDPVVAAFADGSALVVWSSHEADGRQSSVHARLLGPDGRPAAAEMRVDEGTGARNALPAIGVDARGRAVIVWARANEAGVPQSLHARVVGSNGLPLGGEMRLDAREDVRDAMPIEPALGVRADGGFVVAWLESEGGGHAIRVRSFARADDGFSAGAVTTVPASGPGYTSGLAVDANARGETLVAWSRHADGEALEASLHAALLGADGSLRDEPFVVTATLEGEQKLATASGTQRVRLLDDGRMAFAWHGDAGLGDSSGAHVTLLVPEGVEVASSDDARADAFALPAPRDEGAAPHDPPTYDPRDREPPRTEIDGSPTLGSGDFDFLAVTDTGWTPPDPHMAVGPSHVVVMTNGEIAIFDKAGTNLFRDEIEGGSGFWGAQGATGFVFDPEVIYDPHSGRFMAMCCERSSGAGNHGFYLLAISDDSDATGTWHKYRIDSFPTINDTDIDSPNIAADEDVIYLSADFFGPDRLNIIMIDKASVLNGGTPSFTSLNVTGDQSQGFPVTYDTGAPAQYMIGYKPSTASAVRMYAIQNALTVPTLTSLDVAVPSYSHPEDPPQMGTSGRPETFEARFWSAVYRDGRLWATHHVNGSRVRQRWYEFDMANWPVSGTPTLVQSGEIDLGGTVRTYFGSLWVDEANNMSIVYARSSPTEFISMERSWRLATDPPGTTRPPVSIRTSTSPENSGRWGDYSAIVDDPVDASVFWGHHEYRESGWRTRVARWSICDGGVTSYCVTSPNSVGSGAIISSTGSTSIAANDFALFATGCPSGQNGLFYYGAQQSQTAFGNGFKCVAGQLFRLPIVQVDSFGVATQAIDYGNLPAGGDITAGSQWNFQFWYRDPMGGGAAFNLSDALNAAFCP